MENQMNETQVLMHTSMGDIQLKLYNETPKHRDNFIQLVKDGTYNGLLFHRVIKDFMIQGGDPEGTGMGGPGYSIKGEFNYNGFDNSLKHSRGVLSMARAQHPDSAGSQFFIMHANAPHLDGQYAAFGKVTEGIEVVDEIAETPTDMQDKPIEDQIIKTIRLV